LGISSISVYEVKMRIKWDVRGMNFRRPVRRSDSLMLCNDGVASDMHGEVTADVVMCPSVNNLSVQPGTHKTGLTRYSVSGNKFKFVVNPSNTSRGIQTETRDF
jgi:hypothetical protein